MYKMKITGKRKNSIIKTVCVGLAFIVTGLTIMLAVLRPQDKYEKIMSTVIEANFMGGNTCIVVVEYEVEDVKFNNKFNAWKECSVTEKIAIYYKVDNPNRIRPRFYLFFISLTVEAIVIGIAALTSLVAVKHKLKYKSEIEYKRDKTIYYIFVFITLALLLLIPILGAISPLYYF